MFSLLLAIIYISFISLGLPDSLLGASWPVVRMEFGMPLSYAGIISMIIAGGTIISSLQSDRLGKKLGTGLVTAISTGLTATALFGFSVSTQFWMLCLWAIPYGLGAGAVDAAINNYVALHYSSRVMSWLHCFWGVGASISPYIMGAFLAQGDNWRGGYRCVSIIQLTLTAVFFCSLPLWKHEDKKSEVTKTAPMPLKKVFAIKNVWLILIAFLGYCAMETTCGLWASSYLAEYRQIDTQTAARFASLFYIGITVGRFLCGFIADKFGDKKMIRYGIIVLMTGQLLVWLPWLPDGFALAGLIIIGLGCAPVYPSIIHATPDNFGAENSQAIVGVQMAFAYTGSTFMPPIFGLIANHVNIGLFPVYLAVFSVLLLVMTERLNKAVMSKSI